MHDRVTLLKPDTRLASLLENASTKREASTDDFHFIDYQTIQYTGRQYRNKTRTDKLRQAKNLTNFTKSAKVSS